MPSEFRNEPFTDFSKEENAQAMRAALEKVKSELGREYPLVIGGERIETEALEWDGTRNCGRFATQDRGNLLLNPLREPINLLFARDVGKLADDAAILE